MKLIQRCIKDPFAGLSHWIGVGLSIAGLVTLLALSRGRAWYVAGFAVYGATLILLYLASALAHTLRCSPAGDARLTRLDYMAIFLLIAGTYTPLCLVTLHGPWGWGMLAAEWSMAAAGIAAVALGRGGAHWPRTVLYLFMAWVVALVAIEPIHHELPPDGLAWLLAGGVIYSLGAMVFVTNRPHLWPGRFAAHDLWHLMVLAGSACHFIVIYRYVALA